MSEQDDIECIQKQPVINEKNYALQECLDENNSSTCKKCFFTPWHITQIPSIAGPQLYM